MTDDDPEVPIPLVLLFGGDGVPEEHDAACVGAARIAAAADPRRFRVSPVGIDAAGRWFRAGVGTVTLDGWSGRPEALVATGEPVDPVAAVTEVPGGGAPVVFPLVNELHGGFGDPASLCEMAGVACVGSGVLGSELARDKVMTRVVAGAAGVAQPRWLAARSDEAAGLADAAVAELGLPVFVKPATLGLSVGITKAHDREELAAALEVASALSEWVLVEEAVAGREIEVAIVGGPDAEASLPGEVVPSHEFYDFDDKFGGGGARLLVPAPLDAARASEVRALALSVARLLRLEGMARIDFFLDDAGRLLLNEANNIPGFTPRSMFPLAWAASGVALPDLVDRLVGHARDRHARRRALCSRLGA